MIAHLALAAVLAGHPDPLPGGDKVKHFFMSAFIQSVTYAAARSARIDHSRAQVAAGITTMAIGVAKELRDRRTQREFSVPDLGFDAAGALVAAALLNGTR